MIRGLICGAVLVVCALPAVGQVDYESQWDDPSATLGAHVERAGEMYVSVSGGASFLEDSEHVGLEDLGLSNSIEFDTGYTANVAIGKYFGPFRAEGEIGYREADIDRATIAGAEVGSQFFRGEVDALSLMANGYADIALSRTLDWYIGAGIGAARIKGDIAGSGTISGITYTLDSDTDWVFAWQLMTGIGWQVAEPATVTLGYRLWNTEDPEFELGEFESPLIHTVEIGVRFDF